MATELLIIGTGGLAREAAQLARQIDPDAIRWNQISFVAEDHSSVGQRFSHGEIRFTDAKLHSYVANADVVIGIGNPKVRREIAQSLSDHSKFSFPNLIHPSVDIESICVRMGQGNLVTKGVVVTCDIEIGDFNVINWNSTIGHDVSIGSYNVINPGCNLSGHVSVGDECLIGTGTQVLEHLVIVGGVIVGAGSVVTRSLVDRGTYFGIPARQKVC